MKKRLSWKEISETYSGQWVELVDCDWEWNEPHPSFAKVVTASSNRSIIMSEMRQRSKKLGTRKLQSVIIHVGATKSFFPYDTKFTTLELTL
jgi:hypothetical protein